MKVINAILAYAIPILAPVPTGWIVGVSLHDVMGFPLAVAVAAALFVELVGFGGVYTAGVMAAHNRGVSAADRALRVPSWQAWAAISCYLAAVTVLTVLVEFVPAAARFAVLTFPVLGLSGLWLASLQAITSQAAQGLASAKSDRKAEADKRRQEQAEARALQPKRKTSSKADGKPTGKDKPLTSAALREYWRTHPGAGNAETGRAFGVSGEAIRQRRDKMLAEVESDSVFVGKK